MRWSLSFLLLAVVAGCATRPTATDPAARFTLATEDADESSGRILQHLAQREDNAAEEIVAVSYATGRRLPRPGVEATPLVLGVLGPAFDILTLHANRIARASARIAPAPASLSTDPTATLATAQSALRGLAELRGRNWPSQSVRDRGLEGLRALAAPRPEGLSLADFVAQRQPAVDAVGALLLALVGDAPSTGLRATLSAQHAEVQRSAAALMTAARGDRAIGVGQRYVMFRSISQAMRQDPPEVALLQLAEVLRAMPAAHAAVGRDDTDGVDVYVTAVAQLGAIVEQIPGE